MAELLSKLIYSRVIAVSLLGRDKFSQAIEGFFVCLQNYSEESIRHKNRNIFNMTSKQDNMENKMLTFRYYITTSSEHLIKPAQ